MFLKILRLTHAGVLKATLGRILDMLAGLFEQHRYYFNLFFPWLMAGLRLILMIHFFTCGWIMLGEYYRHDDYR